MLNVFLPYRTRFFSENPYCASPPITDTYAPLVEPFDRCVEKNIPCAIIRITPGGGRWLPFFILVSSQRSDEHNFHVPNGYLSGYAAFIAMFIPPPSSKRTVRRRKLTIETLSKLQEELGIS